MQHLERVHASTDNQIHTFMPATTSTLAVGVNINIQ